MLKLLASLVICLAAVPARAYDTIKFLPSFPIHEAKKPLAVRPGLGRFYVLDRKKGLLIYDKDGKFLSAQKPKSERLKNPRGLAVAGGKVYIADAGRSIIRVYGRDGRFLSTIGSAGSGSGQFDEPVSVAVGSDGRVYVADAGNRKVSVFTPDGLFLFCFGTKGSDPGQWKSPDAIAVDASDTIYVLDRSNARIEEFDSSARFLRSIPFKGEDFAVDSYGFIYGIIKKRGRVLEFSPDGALLGRFGSRGESAGQFERLDSVSMDSEGNLVLLDSKKKSVEMIAVANRLKISPVLPSTGTKIFPSGPTASWNYSANPIAMADGLSYLYRPQTGDFLVVDASGTIATRFGSRSGNKESETKKARGMAVSQKLGLYVSDAPNHRLQHFIKTGSGTWAWDKNIAEPQGWFDGLSKEGRLRDPRGVAVNDAGTVYVADRGNRRVEAFTPDGVFLFSIGPKLGGVELQEPVSVAWDKEGFVYILDQGLKKIFKCGPSGELVSSWGREGYEPGRFEDPIALSFDGENYVYVLDRALSRVSAFSKDGRWATDFLSADVIGRPAALAVDGPALEISDPEKGRLLSFRLHTVLSAPSGLSASSQDGIVNLSWQGLDNPWASAYQIERSTRPYSGFEVVAETKNPRYQDSDVGPGQDYYYRVATEAKNGDVGAPSRAVKTVIGETANRPALMISSVALAPIFPANYKWYLTHPLGQAVIANNSDVPFKGLKLTFLIKNYMDFGADAKIERLGPGSSVAVPLIATLNNNILDVTEETPVQADLTLTYFEKGRRREVSLNQPLRVYSRNSITWQDPQRIANFITPNDTPIFNFERGVLHGPAASSVSEALNPDVVKVMRLWEALGAAGVQYAENPNHPFSKASQDPNFPIDYAQFPRETLKRRSGQCDDLTALFISLLDAANVRAAVLDYPGHMAFMFDTEAASWTDAALPKSDLVFYGGSWWVPVEATLIGKPFLDAVENAVYSYQAQRKKGLARLIDAREAWETYEPATLPPTDWSPELPPQEPLDAAFKKDSERVFKAAYRSVKKHLKEKIRQNPGDVDPYLALGIWEFEAGNKSSARKNFLKALDADPGSGAALNNVGNIEFLSRNYARAKKWYLKAVKARPEDPDLWMNLLKADIHLKDGPGAADSAGKVESLDPSYAAAADILLKDSGQ